MNIGDLYHDGKIKNIYIYIGVTMYGGKSCYAMFLIETGKIFFPEMSYFDHLYERLY